MDYVVVVDVSGSMAGPISRDDRRPRIKVVQEALNDFLEAVPDESHVVLIPFSSGIKDEQEFHMSRPGERVRARAFVDRLRPSGETWLWTTVQRALESAVSLHATAPDDAVMVWVLTDGDDTQRKLTLEDLLRQFPQVDGKGIHKSLVLLGDIQLFLSPNGQQMVTDRKVQIVRDPDFQRVVPLVLQWEPQPVRVGDSITFTQESGGTFSLYRWLTNGVQAGSGATLRVAFPKSGRHTVKLVATTEKSGVQTATEVSVEVLDKARIPISPRIRFQPTTVEPQQTVAFELMANVSPSKVIWQVDGQNVGQGLLWETSFPTVGRHTVIGEATDAQGNVEVTQPAIVEVAEPFVLVEFDPIKTIVEDGEEAAFINRSSKNAVKFNWDFGDGASSSDRDGRHVYRNSTRVPKALTVVLTAATTSGRIFQSRPLEIEVRPEQRPVAAFEILGSEFVTGQRIKFLNTSVGVASNGHLWDFNREQMSRELNPEVEFADAGSKRITLEVTGPTGIQEQLVRTIQVNQRLHSLTLNWLDPGGSSTNTPKLIDFQVIPTALIQLQNYVRPQIHEFDILVPSGLPPGSGFVVKYEASKGTNGLTVRELEAAQRPRLPESNIENQTARYRIEIATNAPLGLYEGSIVIQPIGPGVLINGSPKPIRVQARGVVAAGGEGSFLLWMVLAPIGIGTGVLLWKVSKNPPIDGPVVLDLILKSDGDNVPVMSNAPLKLKPNQSVQLGRNANTRVETVVCDLGAPEYFILHRGKSLAICRQDGTQSPRTLKNGTTISIASAQGKPRALSITWQSSLE